MLLNTTTVVNFNSFEDINNNVLNSYSDLNSILSHYAILFLVIFFILFFLHFASVIVIYLWFYNYSDIKIKLNINRASLFIDLLIPFLVYRHFLKLYNDLKFSFFKNFFMNILLVVIIFFSLFNIIFLFLLYFYFIYIIYFVLKKYTLNKSLMLYYILSLGLILYILIIYDTHYRYRLINSSI